MATILNPYRITGPYVTVQGYRFCQIVELNPDKAPYEVKVVACTLPDENRSLAFERAGSLVAELFEARRAEMVMLGYIY